MEIGIKYNDLVLISVDEINKNHQAMVISLPLIISNMHGINERVTGYSCSPDDYIAYAPAIAKMKNDYENRKAFGWKNTESYDMKESNQQMKEIYNRYLNLAEKIQIVF